MIIIPCSHSGSFFTWLNVKPRSARVKALQRIIWYWSKCNIDLLNTLFILFDGTESVDETDEIFKVNVLRRCWKLKNIDSRVSPSLTFHCEKRWQNYFSGMGDDDHLFDGLECWKIVVCVTGNFTLHLYFRFMECPIVITNLLTTIWQTGLAVENGLVDSLPLFQNCFGFLDVIGLESFFQLLLMSLDPLKIALISANDVSTFLYLPNSHSLKVSDKISSFAIEHIKLLKMNISCVPHD